MMLENFLNEAVLYIYRLSIGDIASCAVFMALIFCALYRRFEQKRWLRLVLLFVLGTWCAAVLWITVFNRSGGTYAAHWIPLYTYWQVFPGKNPEAFRSALMNAALFYPAGLLWGSLMPRSMELRKKLLWTILLFGLLSLTIELSQYWLQLGVFEIDDVLHNTLGAVLGVIAFCRFENGTG